MVVPAGGRHDRVLDASPTRRTAVMTPAFAALGVLLVIIAIPLGLMLAPLAIGVLLVWFGLRRLGGVLEPVDGPVPA